MIHFLSGDVRTEFHLLPIDRQQDIMSCAENLSSKGKKITILYVDSINSEICIRIDDDQDSSVNGV